MEGGGGLRGRVGDVVADRWRAFGADPVDDDEEEVSASLLPLAGDGDEAEEEALLPCLSASPLLPLTATAMRQRSPAPALLPFSTAGSGRRRASPSQPLLHGRRRPSGLLVSLLSGGANAR
ncbi:unnamed protein product [Urochloa humidicola]